MSVRVLFCAVGADAGDGDAAAFDFRAGLPFNLGKGIRRKLQPVDVADRAADAADEVRVGIGTEIKAFQSVVDADGIDRALVLEHGEVSIDRRERQVRDGGLELRVDALRRRVARCTAQTFENCIAFAAVLTGNGHGLISFAELILIIIIITVIVYPCTRHLSIGF